MNVWRARFSRWFEPLARRTPLSPNTITVIALLLNVCAALLLVQRQFLVAIVLLAIGGWADAFDGIVARVQQKTSAYGDFLDHFADRVSDVLIITGWLLGNRVRIEITVLAIIAVLLNGYIGTQIEATWHQREYDTIGRGQFVAGMVLYPIASHVIAQRGWESVAPGSLTIAEWMTLALVAVALLGIAQRFALASRLGRSE
jgi:phosphatidylglycerophosphate synthase